MKSLISRVQNLATKLDNWVVLVALSVSAASVKTYIDYSQKGDLFLDDYFLGNQY